MSRLRSGGGTRRFASAVGRLLFIFWMVAAQLLIATPRAALAATNFIVNSTADAVDADTGDGLCLTAGGACTLRAAIQQANALAGADTITLPAGVYTLTIAGRGENAAATGDLDITGPLTMNGAGAATTIIQAGTNASNGIDRIFDVIAGATNVTISGVTMRYGYTLDGAGFGAAAAGAIFTRDTVLIQNSVLTENHSGDSGGAIYAYSPGGLATLLNVEVSNNTAYNDSGAIETGNSFNLVNSTVSGNTSQIGGNGGGAILVNDPAALLKVRNSTIANNTENGSGSGGALAGFFDNNISIENSIITGNSGNQCNLFGHVAASFVNNLVDDATCGGAATPVTNFDSTLDTNSGPTRNHALLAGSNAIDAGAGGCLDQSGSPLAADQRGFARPAGAACDIGAYEFTSTLSVNSTADAGDFAPGDGVCETGAGNGVCTLRAAIGEANALPGADIITFNIPGGGVQTIAPASNLPQISQSVTIDGYTQPGAVANDQASGSDAALRIELDGANLRSNGLTITGPHVTVRGLVINRFTSNGILVSGAGATAATIVGNYIGTDATGTADLSGAIGVRIQNSVFGTQLTGTTIGGFNQADRNVIAGNTEGVSLFGGTSIVSGPGFDPGVTGAVVQGNYIGVASDGITALPNSANGILVQNYPSGNTFGGPDPGEGNVIANSGGNAVNLLSGYRNAVVGNSIYSSASSAIALAGYNGADPGDPDTGTTGIQIANEGQNYPVLSSATADGSQLTVSYSIDSTLANSAYPIAIDVYKADIATSSQGQIYLGRGTISGPGSSSVVLGGALASGIIAGDPIVATATDADGNTSIFSPAATVVGNPAQTGPTFTVNTTADSNDGVCSTLNCTLREAITAANATPGADTINFSIAGGGVQTIALTGGLPTISEAVTIDGLSQPGASCASWPPTLRVQIDATTSGGYGFYVTGGSLAMRGLVLNGYTIDGVFLDFGASGSRFECNFIGSNSAGTASAATAQSGIFFNGSGGNTVGGPAISQRNLITGVHGAQQLRIAGADNNIVQGNYIGTDVTGATTIAGSNNQAILITGSGNQIGGASGTTPGAACTGACNVIGGATGYQIWISAPGATGNIVQGNHIGVNAAGTAALGGFAQAQIQIGGGATSATIGGVSAGEGNLIFGAYSTAVNLDPAAGAGHSIRGNQIFGNGGLGIDLGSDGVTFNHQGALAGPNGYQNYPVLTVAASDGATTRVAGSLDAAPSTSYAIDVYANQTCDPSAFGEGQIYMGSFTVSTDAGGQARFDHRLSAGVAELEGVSATATGPSGTSEFSYCRPASTQNISWVEAQPLTLSTLSTGSVGATASQYIVDRYMEKWFAFPVQPGDTVHLKLTSLAGSAMSLHLDPTSFYNSLNNPPSAAVLSAAAADTAFLPSQSLPSQSLPSQSLPSQSLFSGYLPSQSLPSQSLPSQSLPSQSLPSQSLPSQSLPSQSLPSQSLPTGSLPSQSLPSQSLPSQSLPSQSLPSQSLPSQSLPSQSLPIPLTPESYSGAARRSLVAAAMDPYATVQTIDRAVYDTQGYVYVRVIGPYSLSSPFSLDVSVDLGVCGGIQPIPDNLAAIADGVPAGQSFQSLILTDAGRMHGSPAEISQALADLGALSGLASVQGKLIDLSATLSDGSPRYPRVAFANAQADQFPTCPSAKNSVAREIKAVIDAYRTADSANGGAPSLTYIVLAGGADVIPFYQVADQAGLASEKDYVPPVAPDTPSEAGLRVGLVKGQDYYGAAAELSMGDRTLAVPGLAVGRLVDSAADISAAVDSYVASGGVVRPSSALVTGYDFVGDAAEAIYREVAAGTAATPATLIQDPGLPPTDQSAWSADDLRAQLLGARHDIAVLSGHFSAGNLLAADYRTTLDASEVAGSSANLTDTLILALGCHGGFSLPSGDLLAGASPDPDWAKAFLRKGAAGFVAATGYAYGDTELTEYGERLFVELARELRTGSGPVAIGQALVAAKQRYLAETAQITGIDEKTIVEMTLYGLPMMKVDMPGQRINPAADQSAVTATAPATSGPGQNIGLVSSTAVVLSPALSEQSKALVNLDTGATITTTYYLGPDGVVANPFQPIYPKDLVNVDVSNLALRGVALRGGSYADQSGIVPLTAAPATETSQATQSFESDTFYPGQLLLSNYYDALDGGATRVIAVPAQFKSRAPGAIDGTLRTYSRMNLALYYLPKSWPTSADATLKAAAVAAAPTILAASGSEDGGKVTFNVNVLGDGAAGVQAVWVLYTAGSGPLYGQWQPLDLSPASADRLDPTLWQGELTLPSGASAADMQFMVQAVSGAGLATLATNLGAYYPVRPAGQPAPTPQATAIRLVSPPGSAAYMGELSLTAELTANGQPIGGKTLLLSLGGQAARAITDGAGRATVSLRPTLEPGDYTLQATFRGDDAYLTASGSAALSVVRQATSISLSPAAATIAPGQPTPFRATLSDAAGRPLAGKSVVFVISGGGQTVASRAVNSDYQGAAALGALDLPPGSYSVKAYFSGGIPVGAGQTLSLYDDYYLSAQSGAATLQIAGSDSTPPTITASATRADGSAYSAGTWSNQAVTVHFSCADDGSGVASCPAEIVLSADGQTAAVSGTATDSAGNSADASFGPIWIDATAPTLEPSISGGPIYLNGSATADAGATDSGAGLAGASCDPVATGAVGAQSLTCTATDNAGNSASVSLSYRVIYKFSGFLQPINDSAFPATCGSPCAASIFKGGSTVPAKFMLTDANGAVVQTASAPIWVRPQMGGPVSAGVDESVYSDPASSGSSYRWSDPQYIYNWKTKGFTPGYYWRIGVLLDDGQVYYVTVGLR